MNTFNLALLKVGQQLVQLGEKFMTDAVHLEPVKVGNGTITVFLSKKLPKVEQGLTDTYSALINIEAWDILIEYDWTKYKKYLIDNFDCEDFAIAFASHFSELYGISGSWVYGEVYDKTTGKFIDRHYWNALITDQGVNGLHLYFYEPQNGNKIEITDSVNVVMGSWKYYPKFKITVF